MITIQNHPMLLGAATVTPRAIYYFDFSGAAIRNKTEKAEVEDTFEYIQIDPEIRLRKANRITAQNNFLHSDILEREKDSRDSKNVREWHNRSKYRMQKRTA